MRFRIALLFLLFFISCKQERQVPKTIIEKDRMQELIWDLTRADAFLNNFAGKNDTAFNLQKKTVELYQQIFLIHKTTREEFKKSFEWYQQHPSLMKTILDTLQNRRNKVIQERSKPFISPHSIDTSSK